MPRTVPSSRATQSTPALRPARCRLTRTLFALAGIAVLASAPRAGAEERLPHGQFALLPGATTFDSRQQYGGRDLDASPSLEARLGLMPTRAVRFELAGGFASAKPAGGGASVTVSHVALELAPMFDLPWSFGVAPFLGLGHQSYGRAEDLTSGSTGRWGPEYGVALDYRFGERLALRAETRALTSYPRDAAGTAHERVHAVSGLGVAYAFGGRPRDTDGDGIADGRDRQPATPHGAQVDGSGIALDDDRDGVPNGLDAEPATVAGLVVDAHGAAVDSDHDGVADGADRCADTPAGATVDIRGCPTDTDADGVADGIDHCADTPHGAAVDAGGCPTDADGDLVYDGLDRCADTPRGARVDAAGCPEPVGRLIDTGRIGITAVRFATGSAELLVASEDTLRAIGAMLAGVPGLRIEIGGHCDSRGGDELNQRLSEQRAETVVAFLTRAFPALDGRLVARGYGRSKPVAPNTGARNMARNRRVQFTVLNDAPAATAPQATGSLVRPAAP